MRLKDKEYDPSTSLTSILALYERENKLSIDCFDFIKDFMKEHKLPLESLFSYIEDPKNFILKVFSKRFDLLEELIYHFPKLTKEVFDYYLDKELFTQIIHNSLRFGLFIRLFYTDVLNQNIYDLLCFETIRNNFFHLIQYELEIVDLCEIFALTKSEFTQFIIHFIQHYPPQEIVECKDLILSFLDSKTPLYYQKVDRLEITLELISLLLQPHKIDQANMNVCAAVAVLTLYMEHRKRYCVESFITLLETGQSYKNLPLKANSSSAMSDSHVSPIYLTAIKHASNYLGYYPNTRFFSPTWEVFTGITEPATICRWLSICNFEETTNAILIDKDKNNSISWYYYFLSTDGIQDKDHQFYTSLKENLVDAISRKEMGYELIFFMDKSFVDSIVAKNDGKTEISVFLGIVINHYIVVKAIHFNEETNRLSLTFYSYGNKYTSEVNFDDFLTNYYGFISTKPADLTLLPIPDDDLEENDDYFRLC